MTLMRSPDGVEKDVRAAGVDALLHLGWELVPDKSKPKTPRKRPAKPRKR